MEVLCVTYATDHPSCFFQLFKETPSLFFANNTKTTHPTKNFTRDKIEEQQILLRSRSANFKI
ncbi:unnamed protein product, partial [Nesidiocoris tenuis]